MAEARVKGSLVLGAVLAVRNRMKAGQISEEELEKRLSAEALELLDTTIKIASWYPIRLMTELIDLDWEMGSEFAPEYQRSAGRNTARHFAKTGLYQQVDYAARNYTADTLDDVLRQSRLVCTLTSTLYDFIETRAEIVDGRQLQILFEGAREFPEALRYSTEGFLNEMTRRKTRFWGSDRPSPDLLVFALEIRPRD